VTQPAKPHEQGVQVKNSESFDEHESKVRESLVSAWRFFKQHKKPRTNSDWDKIAIALGEYRDDLTSDLIICLTDEIDREYNHAMNRPGTT